MLQVGLLGEHLPPTWLECLFTIALVDMVKVLKERIHNRDNSFGKSNGKHVYRSSPCPKILKNGENLSVTILCSRVLQCHEDELTQMVSTMSDGWKFEQVNFVLMKVLHDGWDTHDWQTYALSKGNSPFSDYSLWQWHNCAKIIL